MTEYKRDLKEDLAIFDIGGRSTEDIVYGVVAPHALERAITAEEEVERLNHLLTEKDATIKRLEKENQWLYGKLNQIGMLVERGRSEEGDKE